MKKPKFLRKVHRLYFVGIKGVGMTALACCGQDVGLKISGSDLAERFVTDEILAERKIPYEVGFDASHIVANNPDMIITTGAHGGLNNPEVIAARERHLPIMTHAEALGNFMDGKEGISVCGVGGKTTTASMIAHILSYAKYKPSFAIGSGKIKSLGLSGKYSTGKYFIAEGDEFANSAEIDNRPRFFFQNPKIVVVTNIEYDHPDIYKNFNQTKAAFKGFFQKIPDDGILIACLDNQNTKEVVKEIKNKQTYGLSPLADWHIDDIYYGYNQTIFNLTYKELTFPQIKIKVPGKFNVLNAVAAFAVAFFCEVKPEIIKKALSEFSGVKRRFEFIGEKQGIKLYDDYAHHPQEIKATLTAAKEWFPQNRLIVVFQPHTYSRTKALFGEFARSFSSANIVVISDIYASAREKETLGVSSKKLSEETSKFNANTVYQKGEKEVVNYLKKTAVKGDIIITMGAGDIFLWHKTILNSLKK